VGFAAGFGGELEDDRSIGERVLARQEDVAGGTATELRD
jgi:hypothetical protein